MLGLILMKSTVRNTAILALTAMLAISLLVPIIGSTESSAAISITDSDGKTINLDEPAGKIVTLGFGFTITAIDLGYKDKIVGYDGGSTYASSGNEKVLGMEDVTNMGSAYATDDNIANILAHMLQMSEGVDSKFDKSKDVIIINNWSGTVKVDGTRDQLVDKGFKVVCFGADTYDEIHIMIHSMSELLGGDPNNVIAKMDQAKTDALSMAASKADEPAPKAMYVSESSGTLRIYNSGIAVSMIELAGGENVGNNGGTATYHAEDASFIIQSEPQVVFLDGNYSGTEEYFQDEVLKTRSIKVVKLEKDWNSTTPQVAEGLSAISEALYSSHASGGDSGDQNILMIAAGGITAIVVAGLAVFLLRRR